MSASRESSFAVDVDSSLVESLVERGGRYDAVVRLPEGTSVGGVDVGGHYVPVTVDEREVAETPEGLMCARATTCVGIDPGVPVFPFRFEDGRRRVAAGLGDGGLAPRAVARALSIQASKAPGTRALSRRIPRSVAVDPKRVDGSRVGPDLSHGGGLRADISLDGVSVGGRSLAGFTLTASVARGGDDPTTPIEVRADASDALVWRRSGDGAFQTPEPALSPAEMDELYEQVASRSPRHLRPVPRAMAMRKGRLSPQRATAEALGADPSARTASAHVIPPDDDGSDEANEEIPLDDLIAEVMF